MRESGTLPCRRQWAWIVKPDPLHGVPTWTQQVAVRGLGMVTGRVWLWPTDARRLMREVRRAGWRCEATKFELRHCAGCSRPYVGFEAERRRRLDESGPGGRLLPCGSECAKDAASGVWRKLNPCARMAGIRARGFAAERQAA